jgi:release factor glutamine methyltransferase
MSGSHFALASGLSRANAQRAMTAAFAGAGLATPALDARLLLCAGLGLDHVDLVRYPDSEIGAAAPAIAALAERRLQGEPVSRILGHREFYGLDFAIGPAVLDPRADTEILVEAVLARLATRQKVALKLVDFGIGSGAILGALLSHLPSACGLGVDRSEPACRLAQANLAHLGLRARSAVICGDWAEALAGAFDVIVANPPYIATGDIGALAPEVRAHDPRAALDGGADGLAAYRRLAPAAARLVATHGVIAFEVGLGQADSVAALLLKAGLRSVDMKRDLAGHIRVVTAIGDSGA